MWCHGFMTRISLAAAFKSLVCSWAKVGVFTNVNIIGSALLRVRGTGGVLCNDMRVGLHPAVTV